jgi:hypothetical protein
LWESDRAFNVRTDSGWILTIAGEVTQGKCFERYYLSCPVAVFVFTSSNYCSECFSACWVLTVIQTSEKKKIKVTKRNQILGGKKGSNILNCFYLRTGLWNVTRSHVGDPMYDKSCTVFECSCRDPFNGPTPVFPYKDFEGPFIKKNRLICQDSIQKHPNIKHVIKTQFPYVYFN